MFLQCSERALQRQRVAVDGGVGVVEAARVVKAGAQVPDKGTPRRIAAAVLATDQFGPDTVQINGILDHTVVFGHNLQKSG